MATSHTRRTPEQIVAEYEQKIAAVKARAAAKKSKASPDGATFLNAARGMQKALAAAEAATNAAMERALESALATLSAHAVEAGLRMPVPRDAKAAKRKKTTAA